MTPTKAKKLYLRPRRAGHAFKKLAAIENAYAVEEHDQANQSDRTGDLSFGCKGPKCKPDE